MSLKILHFGRNTTLARDIQNFGSRTTDGLQIAFVTSYEKLLDQITKQKFDVVLVELDSESSLPSDWIFKLRAQHRPLFESGCTLFVLISSHSEAQSLRLSLSRGYVDVVSSPVDISLLLQKLQLYLRDKRFLKENLLFSMDMSEDCEVSISGKIIKAAEYGATILTDREFPLDQIITIHSKMPTAGDDTEPMIARVVGVNRANELGNFFVAIAFVGTSKRDLSNIRIWLRKHYVSASHLAEGS